MHSKFYDVLIIGGGAAGYFSAINIAERYPKLKIAILEASPNVLQKVKISGGGRCNVSHACFDPQELVKAYPRGEKELLGPFYSFGPAEMLDWLLAHDVPTKTERDNRIFPSSNSSQTIIDCFIKSTKKLGVELITEFKVKQISKHSDEFKVSDGEKYLRCHKLIVCTGSSVHMWKLLKGLGHRVIDPVPSLFTLKVKDPLIQGLQGLSVSNGSIEIEDAGYQTSGPILITHWGFSGPAVLRLSAIAAVYLNSVNYNCRIKINWAGQPIQEVILSLKKIRKSASTKRVTNTPYSGIPKRLWQNLCTSVGIASHLQWANITNQSLHDLADTICNSVFEMKGKSTFKEEFVTAGGIDLKEIDFKKFESKILPGLYFAGEVLNIDAITGGFNFQAAWTGAWHIAEYLND